MPKIARFATVARLCWPLFAAAVLAGCADYGTRQFGVRRDLQEQTRVTTPPPLSLPPILTERTSQGDGPSASHAEANGATSERAASEPQSALARAHGADSGPSPGETSLLDESGPSAPSDIRQKVDQDAQLGRVDPGTAETILYGQPSQQQMIQRGGSKSWLDRIF